MKISAIYACLTLAMPAFAQACDALEEQLNTRDGISAYLKQDTSRELLCAVALIQNGKTSSFCYAMFDYRSPDAHTALVRLEAAFPDCFPTRATSGAGEVVNHPDSFDQKQFCTPEYDLSLSFKDKATLSQTLVFLRLDESASRPNSCE
ncbi:MAG: hypothetical protein P8P65_09635 [Planktotalea sp.]|uniref:hypothetical protein n=1 Tax=Planktotalea sp. TaxID=2029877 RepID=UPI0012EAA499|nr:hypothetical protein [Planktotalea sp.]MBT5821491.1 hypothetical protein [Paracoccaceae bacterium]MDG1076893.1 hypothetical protein [Planktotalea sp.]MDG1084096.1 hypothetical protein [Planktotalea sp.]